MIWVPVIFRNTIGTAAMAVMTAAIAAATVVTAAAIADIDLTIVFLSPCP